MKHNLLLPALRTAFPPEKIASSAFAPHDGRYSDSPAYSEALAGKTWEELDPTYLASRVDVLCFADPAQRVALLPLYLHLLIAFSPQSPVAGTLLWMLTAPESDDPTPGSEWARAKFERLAGELTDAQKAVVATTLHEFVARHVDAGRQAQLALDRYWGRFADGRHNPLRDQLRAAFPSKEVLATDNLFDDSRRHFATPLPGFRDSREVAREESAEYLRGIEGKTWEQLDPPFAARFSLDLEHFSKRHFVEVLPAFLNLLIVVDPSPYAPNNVVGVLTPPNPESSLYDRERARFDRVPLLDDAQRAAITATLRLFVEMYPHQSARAAMALARFWHPF